MAGFGKFKLTDALPAQPSEIETSQSLGSGPAPPVSGRGKSKGKGKGATAKGKPAIEGELAAEQVREAGESDQAKNAEASIRDHMVDIGRGNQQAGRQRGK